MGGSVYIIPSKVVLIFRFQVWCRWAWESVIKVLLEIDVVMVVFALI